MKDENLNTEEVAEAVSQETSQFIDRHTDDGLTRFEVQYYDDPQCWTVPVLLTAKRAEYLKNDHSVSRIRFTIIIEKTTLKNK